MITELGTIAYVALALVFLLSAWPKLRRPRRFAIGITSYVRVPMPMLFAITLATTEVAIGSLLIVSGSPSVLLLAIGLLTLFALIAVRNLASRTPLPCYCFGADSRAHPRLSAIRLIALFALVLIASQGAYAGLDLYAITAAVGLLLLARWSSEFPTFIALARAPRLPAPASGRRSFADVPLVPPGSPGHVHGGVES